MTQGDEFVPPKTSWFLRITILAIVLAFGIVGTGFAREAVDTLTLARDADEFAATRGEITRASVRSEGADRVPEVKFSYTVDGQRHEGSNRHTANSYRDVKLASRESGRFKVGQRVPVFYDAREPSRALLSRDVPLQRAYVRLGYAALFYGIALFSLITYTRSRKKMRVLAYAKHVERERQRSLKSGRSARSALGPDP